MITKKTAEKIGIVLKEIQEQLKCTDKEMESLKVILELNSDDMSERRQKKQ